MLLVLEYLKKHVAGTLKHDEATHLRCWTAQGSSLPVRSRCIHQRRNLKNKPFTARTKIMPPISPRASRDRAFGRRGSGEHLARAWAAA